MQHDYQAMQPGHLLWWHFQLVWTAAALDPIAYMPSKIIILTNYDKTTQNSKRPSNLSYCT